MPVHYNIIPADKNQNIPPAMTKIDVKAGAKKLAPAVKKALESARKADDKFAKWFCPKGAEGHDEVQKLVVNLLTNMSEFLDKTTNTVNIKLMAKDADSSLYAYVWPDLGRSNKAGQWFVYLGPCIVKKEAGVKDIFLLTLAHEKIGRASCRERVSSPV